MNKELILKYKAEFNHWLNGGQIEYKLKSSSNLYNNLKWDIPINDIEYLVIKPEELQFKVGDFVRQIKEVSQSSNIVYRLKSHIADICYSVENNIYNVDAINAKEGYFELWKPQAGELCWFTDTDPNVSVLAIFKGISEYETYITKDDIRYDLCKPFLNSKPSWFKD